ncbi:hypothetical protein QZM97_01240 [Burkholderia orbicola]|uniref:2OG-Fe(II) oxygenase n=4 Tax=Burkholderia cepacia complex TaxID=87882 RepID=A0A3R9BG89_9BURK|nr:MULTISPECIES: hypothetical protein [Burkholderia]EKS9842584.1 hypothetical protein [Burkholderia cepacia]ABK12394.1 conserved hypothetical protein [Burkholderia cenocepacia HI2424]AQQ25667.1 hypothetical protein A8E88_08315 [Burkholderia cenocepacia]AQT54016.1 hypothetical protein BHQ31_29235 [Burkholderia cenocepacia]MBJ9671482.1 hypothetical protein [Burkholderia cenocepacia]
MRDQVQKESSELIVIDRRLDNTAPWQEWANQIVDQGFAIISIGPRMQDDFHALQQLAGTVGFRDKQEFCFVDRTDGYFPVGYSHIGKENSDRCEIFNYWHRFKDEHQQYEFSRSEFYSRIASYEAQVAGYGQKLVDEIRKRYGYAREIPTRDDSYLQYNHYREDLRLGNSRYLQGKHEDGHLITVIKPNAPGLVLFQGDKECLVDVAKDQAIAISGSLLTELSDGEIQPTFHAVLNLTLPTARASIVYNVNVLSSIIPSFKQGRDIRMYDFANERHLEFGHAPYVIEQV